MNFIKLFINDFLYLLKYHFQIYYNFIKFIIYLLIIFLIISPILIPFILNPICRFIISHKNIFKITAPMFIPLCIIVEYFDFVIRVIFALFLRKIGFNDNFIEYWILTYNPIFFSKQSLK